MPQPADPAAPLRVVVVGAGAVGSFLGGTLAAAGCAVTLLTRRPTDGLGQGELVLEEPSGTRRVPVRRAALEGAGPPGDADPLPDLVIVAVKAFDLEAALETARQWPGAAILTVQNGVGAEALADAWIPYPTPLLAASLTAAIEPVPGGVRRLRTGGIGLAVVREDGSDRAAALVARLAAAWSSVDLPARVVADADAMKWSKLLANLVGNATSAILDLSPGEVYADPRTYEIERRQLREATAVMRALGLRPVRLPGADVSLLLRGLALPAVLGRPIVSRAVAGARGGKSPSLRLAVREGPGGPTEARWLNGAVAAAGAARGVPTPVNDALATLVDEVARDPRRAAWFARDPGRLAEAVAVSTASASASAA